MGKTLIVCEKPSAASKIAEALAEKRPAKKEFEGVPYYEFERGGGRMVVVPALGHLFTLKNLRPMRDYPVYDIDWMPAHEVDRKAKRSQVFVEAIKELAKDATDYISACDYDLEGSVIAYNVLKYLCGEDSLNRAKRMKFSTLTAQDLKQSYEELMPRLDFELIDAGVARHVLDWYWGMNISKAMSAAVEEANKRFAKLSAGRVQTPTLKILVEREHEIKAFKPEPFWVLSLLLELEGKEVVAEHATPRFLDKSEAERAFAAAKDKPAKVSAIQTRKYRRSPPIPFDLGLLQSEAYRCFGYTPMRTQQLAQLLYQAALVSYPRTSSQKLPLTINYAKIIGQLGGISKQYKKIADELLATPELKPNEGKKCVVGETLVILSDGEILPIKELVGGHNRTEVVGIKNDLSTVHSKILDRFSVSGRKELVNITLQNNDEILVTLDHPVLVLEEKPEWTNAGDIREGMLLAVPERINVKRKTSASNVLEVLDMFSEEEQQRILLDLDEIREVIKRKASLHPVEKRLSREIDFKYNTVRSYFQRGRVPYSIVKLLLREGIISLEDLKKRIKGYTWAGAGGNKIIKLPFSFTPEFLYFVGIIAADGHNTGREVQIYNSEGLGNVFHRCCSSFGLEVKNYGQHLSVASKLLCEILDKLCVFKGNKAGKLDFPNLILKQPDPLVLAFIAGFFDGDGSVSITKGAPVISIGSKSKLFLEKLKLTLSTFGISSRFHSNAIRIYLDDARRFHKTVRKSILVKKRELDLCTKMKNVRSSKTVLLPSKNIKLKLSECGLSIQDLATKIGRIRYTTRSGYDSCYLFTKDKLSKASSILQDPLLDALSNGDVTWKKVKRTVRRKCNVPLYDLTTSCKNFIGNGVILHNCDPAHPSVYPTGEKPEKLAGPQKKLYDLIVRRFFSVFGKPALAESIRVDLDVGGQPFFLRGRRVLEEGWLAYYGSYGATEEIILPQLSEGQELAVREVKFEEKETQPPPRYNPSSIVKEMEARNLGTKCLCGNVPVLTSNFRTASIQELYENSRSLGNIGGILSVTSPRKSLEPVNARSSFEESVNRMRTEPGHVTCLSFNPSTLEIIKKPAKASRRETELDEEALSVQTKYGSIEVTSEHPIFIVQGDKVSCKRAAEIKVGDKLLAYIPRSQTNGETVKLERTEFIYGPSEKLGKEVAAKRKELGLSQDQFAQLLGVSQTTVHDYEGGSKVPISILAKLGITPQFVTGRSRSKVIPNPFPICMSSSLVRLLGRLTGDGSFGRAQFTKENSCDFRYYNTEPSMIKSLLQDVMAVFKVKLKVNSTDRERKRRIYRTKLPGVVGRILIDIAPEIMMHQAPKIVLSNKQFWADYLSAIFDDEVAVPTGELELRFSQKSKKLVSQITSMLNEFGIRTWPPYFENGSWRFGIYGRRSIERFLLRVGLTHPAKLQRLLASAKKRPSIKKKTMIYCLLSKGLEPADIARELKYSIRLVREYLYELLSDGLIGRSRRYLGRGKGSMSKYFVKIPFGATFYALLDAEIITHQLCCKPVHAIKHVNTPRLVYDLSVDEKSPSFVAGTDNIVVHNSTRAPILQNIYVRGYIFGNQITVTDLGIEVIDSLLKHCPEIVSEELTAQFEREMEAIQEGKRDKEEVIEKARKELDKLLKKFRAHELEIGKQLGEAYRITRQKQRIMGKCAKCGGDLKLIVSRATHKRFAGCSNYPKCDNSFPLPQNGIIISLGKTCEQCGAPMIQVNRIGMRPYRMCLDPKCPSKADWGKKKRAKSKEPKSS